MNYVSYTQLAKDVREFAANLPEFKTVLGVPRSGMLVASMIAAERNWELGAADPIHGIRALSSGSRFAPNSSKNILVVDDTTHEGSTLLPIMHQMRDGARYAALYASGKMASSLDHYHRIVPAPRLFAWNWRHHTFLDSCLVDLDGLLCEDPSFPEIGNEDRYASFVSSARQIWFPTKFIMGVVSARIVKWTEPTKQWLLGHGINYGTLSLLDATARERLDGDMHWRHKAKVYAASAAHLFIESDREQAALISADVGRPVLCPTTDECF